MPEMKDSGIEWIGKIPKDWEIIKIGGVYSLRNTKVSDIDYPPLSVTMKGILPQLETAAKTNDHDNRKLVKKGDFAINSRSDRRGSCGISDYDGSVSLINTVLKPNRKMVNGYYNWLFHTTEFADEFYRWGHGIVDDLWTTNWQDMKKMSVPYPSVEKQEVISAFLDIQCSEIDSLHVDIEKQIDILERYKKSVITEAVTKGLDPNVEMKDSGIEWIGEIPKGWICTKIGRYSFITKLAGFEFSSYFNYFADGNVIALRGINLKNFEVDLEDVQTITDIVSDILPRSQVKLNDILVSYAGSVGNVGFIDNEDYRYHLAPNVGKITIISNLLFPKFVAYYFISKVASMEIFQLKNKNAQESISMENLRRVRVIIPPYDEQQKIVNYLDSKCAEINSAIDDKKKQLETLETYKRSLIYEYITGKKEVPT